MTIFIFNCSETVRFAHCETASLREERPPSAERLLDKVAVCFTLLGRQESDACEASDS
jgi:hypothetical protein